MSMKGRCCFVLLIDHVLENPFITLDLSLYWLDSGNKSIRYPHILAILAGYSSQDLGRVRIFCEP